MKFTFFLFYINLGVKFLIWISSKELSVCFQIFQKRDVVKDVFNRINFFLFNTQSTVFYIQYQENQVKNLKRFSYLGSLVYLSCLNRGFGSIKQAFRINCF